MTYNPSIARNFVRYSPTIPQMNKFKFILVNNCEKFEKGLWSHISWREPFYDMKTSTIVGLIDVCTGGEES